jgi:hypothetical protein
LAVLHHLRSIRSNRDKAESAAPLITSGSGRLITPPSCAPRKSTHGSLRRKPTAILWLKSASARNRGLIPWVRECSDVAQQASGRVPDCLAALVPAAPQKPARRRSAQRPREGKDSAILSEDSPLRNAYTTESKRNAGVFDEVTAIALLDVFPGHRLAHQSTPIIEARSG